MTNAKKYYNEVSKSAADGRAIFMENSSKEEIAQLIFDESPEGIAAEAERSRVALANRFAAQEVERKAKNAAKKAAKAARRAAREAEAA